MLLASSGFVTICPKKEVELGADRHLHRADHAEELRQEIAFDCPKATGNQYAYMPGGAVRAINPNSSMTLAETESMIGVFKGNLFNKAELAAHVLGLPASTPEAQLLLKLYAAKGLDMLGMLKGQYAFCLYDSKQARVLAARDHSGAVPLMEGRTAAGSLIIACGTFLPDGVTQLVDIQPGEYKYGWHALPRAFRCGETKIVAGRASCEYGIRRRSIDAYNAPPARRSVDLPRHGSLDIPRQHSGSHHAAPTSHSYSHTPGRYMPPHLAAAAAAGGSGGFGIRQRAMSLDGAHAQQKYGHSSTASPATAGRRRSDTNNQVANRHHHTPAAQQQWVAKSPAVTTSSKLCVSAPPPIQTPSAGGVQTAEADEVATPCSLVSSTPSTQGSAETPHRRRRRHHRRGRGSASPSTAASAKGEASEAAADGQESEADSQVSSSTHDSANSAPAEKQQKPVRKASKGTTAHKPQGNKHHQQQQPMQQALSGSGGFKRNSSCGELAVLGSSPSGHAHSVLMAAPQGLAC